MTHVVGWNAAFAIESATPGTYTEVANVVSMTLPSITREAVENTTLKASQNYATFIAGGADAGEVSIVINWVPAASASDVLLGALNAGLDNFRITFPNGVTLTFAGVTTTYEMGELERNTGMTATLTVKLSGVPALAAS